MASTSEANVVGELLRERQHRHFTKRAAPTTSEQSLLLCNGGTAAALHEWNAFGFVERILPMLSVEPAETSYGCLRRQEAERTSTSKSAAARVDVSGICSSTVEKPAGRGTASARRSRGWSMWPSDDGRAGMPARTAVASSDSGCGDDRGDDKASVAETLVRPAIGIGMEASLKADEDDAEERRT